MLTLILLFVSLLCVSSIAATGVGKTSLLHALSGKTFHGSVAGKIMVNGQKTTLETHGNIVGFVPEVGSRLMNE